MTKAKQTNHMFSLILALMLVAGLVAAVSPESAHATGSKALKAPVTFTGVSQASLYDGTRMNDDAQKVAGDNMYSLAATCKKPLQLKKNMKVSAQIYIPKALLKKNNSVMNIYPMLICSRGEEFIAVGGKYAVVLSKKSGRAKLNLYAENGGNYTSVKKKKMAKVTRTKNFYVVKLNSYPLKSTDYFKNAAIPTTGEYKTDVLFSLAGFGTAYQGNIYVDNLKLKSKKTTAINFNKRDYKAVYGFKTINNAPIKVKVSRIK